MPGKDTTGTYDTRDYVLGRGRMYLSELDENGLPKEYRDVGNVPSFTLSVAEEELEHFTTRQGLKVRDRTVTLTKDITMAFSLDTIVDQNLALFFSADQVDYTNPAIAGFAEWQIIDDDAIKSVTTWYRITDSSLNQALGIDSSNLTLKTTNATPVTLVEDTDYEVLPREGLFRLLDSTEVQNAITNNEGITAELTADASAKNADEVRALKKSSVVVGMLFVAENPANDDEVTNFTFHQVKLRADGDMAVISEEWQELPMAGTVEANETASPNSPHLTIQTLKAS